MILKSIDYGDISTPTLVGDHMDEDYKEKDDEELEKGSDTDLVQSILADESGGLDALQQAIDQTQDPQLKEILEAIKEDETKHTAALQQWVEMAGGSGEEEPPGEEEAAPEPAPDEGGEEVPIESDADLNDGPMDEEEEEAPLDKGDAPKSDLIDEIRAILAEHEAEKADEEEDAEKSDDGDEDDDKPDFLKEDEEDEDLEKEDDEGEDGEEDDLDKSCDKINKRIAFIAKAQDQQVVYGVVSEPGTVDLQGDRLSESEIRKACHKFMMTSQKIGKEHNGEAKADIIESYIAPVDFRCGGQHVRKGSWVMAVKIHDPAVWRDVKKGEITGFSIAGTGTRTEF